MWQHIPAVFIPSFTQKMPVYFSHYQHHYIFFRELPNGDIGLMIILQDSMDIPVNLLDCLSYIEHQFDTE